MNENKSKQGITSLRLISVQFIIPLDFHRSSCAHEYIYCFVSFHRKAWNSWNTSGLRDGLRAAETAVEDVFIRKFVTGTWHRIFLSEIVIKRRHNAIYIGGIIHRYCLPRQIYFLIGYTEEFLSYILKCPIKMEIQSTADPKDVVHKYV